MDVPQSPGGPSSPPKRATSNDTPGSGAGASGMPRASTRGDGSPRMPPAASTGTPPPSGVIDKDFQCPICLEQIKEAFMTQCGHSFCYLCIIQHLEHKQDQQQTPSCPACSNSLTREQIYPNFTLNKLLEKKSAIPAPANPSQVKQIQSTILNIGQISVNDINTLLSTLKEKKKLLEQEEHEVEVEVLLDFLQRAKEQKQKALGKLTAELDSLKNDIASVEMRRPVTATAAGPASGSPPLTAVVGGGAMDLTRRARKRGHSEMDEDMPDAVATTSTAPAKGSAAAAAAAAGAAVVGAAAPAGDAGESIQAKKKRVYTHFDDLLACYFDARRPENASDGALAHFTSKLSKFSRFSRFRVNATLKYGDIFNTSSIVSSIEFDRDDEYFATAGVTKKIKIFEFNSIVSEPVEVHYPIREMSCRSKISCLSWNSYIKSQIASSDYEGIVSLWDAYTGQSQMQLEEHEKRVWSVDFSRADPTRLASGSDDTKVKIWSTNQERSVASIESKANICCVKFNPELAHHIAFGSADHHVHYYDLRKLRHPLLTFKGHRKAVSYVKWLNKNEFVSASTDSSLKLWNATTGDCVRTFQGHSNEKNFVGLTASEEFVACGSENNAVFTYYKALSKPIVQHKFGSSNPVTGEESDEDQTQFVSSVCWRRGTNILLAANSQGTIKVMELI